MSKAQMYERIKQTSQNQLSNIMEAFNHVNQMNDYDSQVLAELLLATTTGIVDSLNNISLILCEMLSEED